ncbi:hydroxymethylglutaryl-CoA reductase [Nonlabens ulvanivorans]|nr:hydroxymethylglutaryl-CoA reductase [Nonlabens ulvanivorans]
MDAPVIGFSKLSKKEKVNWLVDTYFDGNTVASDTITRYWNQDEKLQELHDGFSENTITNYYFPFGLAPNFLIDGQLVTIPMAIEESSVVAAASKAAKFWLERGGLNHYKVNDQIGSGTHYV